MDKVDTENYLWVFKSSVPLLANFSFQMKIIACLENKTPFGKLQPTEMKTHLKDMHFKIKWQYRVCRLDKSTKKEKSMSFAADVIQPMPAKPLGSKRSSRPWAKDALKSDPVPAARLVLFETVLKVKNFQLIVP